ncbi:MAG: hypothetical protein KIT20_09255 [Alphaproteobacteria bacterium]|nr:hypothetical protein [Alphaproteobacteria bacterium]
MTDLSRLSQRRLRMMLEAGEEVLRCQEALARGGLNIVGEVLRGQGTFYEWNHYPEGDVYDRESHSQYYYHSHRGEQGEHGHFHTFLRRAGMPAGIEPAPMPGRQRWPSGEEELSHLIAISMDTFGAPVRLFATNRWVTGEAWFRAEDVIRMLDRFSIDHAYPSWPVNRWLSSMIRLFQPQIAELLRERDRVIREWKRGEVDVLEDTALEVTGAYPIAVDRQIARVRQALSKAEARG